MTTSQLLSPEFTGIDDLTLAEVDAKLKEHQQLLQVLLQSPGSMLSYLPQNDAASTEHTETVQQEPKAEQLFQQALVCSAQQDLFEAATFYCRAAYAGHLQAQVQLGHCYLKGAGVPKSAVFAYSWFILAALQQDSTAQQACTVLCKHLTVLDQQQAQQLAAERFEKITLQNNK
ncbi:MAG: SEL1-like repeat protein [Gammaproteobacteria bacterium]|nr:SEL1-like repeat protein [Gammaproteobacteria bacterium]